jgi:hypothetical protein
MESSHSYISSFLTLSYHNNDPHYHCFKSQVQLIATDTRRSTSGFLIKFRGSPILWASRRQKAISRSSLESEYIALSQGCQNVLWILKLLKQIGYPTSTVPVYIDNQGAIESTKNGTHSERTKDIDVAYKYGRELLQAKVISLVWCPTDNMTADILTKALG